MAVEDQSHHAVIGRVSLVTRIGFEPDLVLRQFDHTDKIAAFELFGIGAEEKWQRTVGNGLAPKLRRQLADDQLFLCRIEFKDRLAIADPVFAGFVGLLIIFLLGVITADLSDAKHALVRPGILQLPGTRSDGDTVAVLQKNRIVLPAFKAATECLDLRALGFPLLEDLVEQGPLLWVELEGGRGWRRCDSNIRHGPARSRLQGGLSRGLRWTHRATERLGG